MNSTLPSPRVNRCCPTDLDPDSPLRDAAQRQRDEEFGADAAHQQSLFALPDTADVTITINAIID